MTPLLSQTLTQTLPLPGGQEVDVRIDMSFLIGAVRGAAAPAAGPTLRNEATGLGGVKPTFAAATAGDLLVVAGLWSTSQGAPAGWTKQAERAEGTATFRLHVFTKVAAGGETTLDTAGTCASSWVARAYQGAAGVDSVASGAAGTGASITCPDVTVVAQPVVLHDFILAYEGDTVTPTVTPPAGETAQTAVPDNANLLTLVLATKSVTANGATGTRAATASVPVSKAVVTLCAK